MTLCDDTKNRYDTDMEQPGVPRDVHVLHVNGKRTLQGVQRDPGSSGGSTVTSTGLSKRSLRSGCLHVVNLPLVSHVQIRG